MTPTLPSPRPAYVFHAETMGRGDDILGKKLMGGLLRTLAEAEPKPVALVFYNAAVKLLSPDSPYLDALRHLDESGVDLLACVTCLEFFGLTERLAVGEVSNMRAIVTCLNQAQPVITV